MAINNYQPNVDLYLDGKAFLLWETININSRINGLSDITLDIPNNKGQFSSRFPNGTEIEVYMGWSNEPSILFWSGKSEQYSIPKNKKSSEITLWGRDKGRIYDDELTVDNEFEPYSQFEGTYAQLINLLNNNLSVPLTLSLSNADTDLSIVKDFEFEKSINELTDACQKGGYEWFYEGRSQALIVRPPESLIDENVVKTYLLGQLVEFGDLDLSNYALMKSDKLTVDSSDKITWVRFDGIEGIKGIYPATQPTILKEYYEQSNEWTTNDAAYQAAMNKYNNNRFDRTSLEIQIPFGEDSVILGNIVRCDDSKYGLSTVINKLYRVIELSHSLSKKGGWTSSLGLGDFTPKITDFL